MAGIGESLVLVAFCGLCTFLTGISLSAIATNGAMKVSISYDIIKSVLTYVLDKVLLGFSIYKAIFTAFFYTSLMAC
jgi:Na+-translocating ferredoxin:NAD+ oxidoreductase RnfA subunit